MNDITPKDAVETKALGIGQRISAAIGIIIAMGSALLAAFGDTKWITDNLPLLGTGVGALVTGGLTSYVAIRRMRVDKIGKTLIALLLLVPLIALLSGCAVVSGKAGESHYVGFAFGEKASSTLAGLTVTETKKTKGNVIEERGVGIDQAGSSGQADMGKILGNLLLLGLQSQGIPVKASASAASQADSSDPSESTEASTPSTTSTEPAAVSYDATGYDGAPAADGSGVYGRPSCGRCRAWHAAHPDTPIINTEVASNRSALWAALKKRGFTGTVADLPVQITDDSYTSPAK